MENARAKAIEIDTASFIETNNIIDAATGRKIGKYASQEIAVVFTSMNAAEAVIDCLNALGAEPEWTVYTLGGVTQKILEDALEGSEIFGDAINATQIARTVIENEEEEVVFFCGNQRRDELPTLLKKEEIKVDEVVVYETIVATHTVLFAIGTTTADELKKHSNNKVLVGSQPNKEFLAEQAMQYLLKASQADS
jgi:uroporphyrinogen-III synthase